MSRSLENRCRAYLNDELSPEERKKFEQQLAGGDKDLIETIQRLKRFSISGEESSKEDNKQTERGTDTSQLLSYITTESDPDTHNSSQSDSARNSQKPADNPFDLAEEKSFSKQKKVVITVISVVFVLLAILLIYAQWQQYMLSNKTDVLSRRVTQSETQLNKIQRNLRETAFQRDRVIDIMRSDFPTLTDIPIEHESLQQWTQLWDRGTLRAAVVLKQPALKTNQEFQLWSYNIRDRQWLKAGSIDDATSDSIYTSWTATSLARSERIRIVLFDTSDSSQVVLGEHAIGK